MRKALSLMLIVVMTAAFCGLAFAAGMQAAGEEMTIRGTVNANNQVVDDQGVTYTVVDDAKGMELSNHAGKMVEIMGTVQEDMGKKTITVREFKLEN